VPEHKDGFFAHWVEAGVAGENSYTGRNTGVFSRTLKQTKVRMQNEQLKQYKKNFEKYFR
jgi:hypothetical protein